MPTLKKKSARMTFIREMREKFGCSTMQLASLYKTLESDNAKLKYELGRATKRIEDLETTLAIKPT
jgi:ribosome-binding protein aMBF1 (putative translation factor)